MINGISITGKYMVANGGYSSTPYVNMSNPSAGMVRYNGNSNNLEIYDGSSWMTYSSTIASVGLNAEAESLLDWAKKKRDEEAEWYKLASNNEAFRIALEQLEQAKTRVEITAKLVREHDTTTTS